VVLAALVKKKSSRILFLRVKLAAFSWFLFSDALLLLVQGHLNERLVILSSEGGRPVALRGCITEGRPSRGELACCFG